MTDALFRASNRCLAPGQVVLTQRGGQIFPGQQFDPPGGGHCRAAAVKAPALVAICPIQQQMIFATQPSPGFPARPKRPAR